MRALPFSSKGTNLVPSIKINMCRIYDGTMLHPQAMQEGGDAAWCMVGPDPTLIYLSIFLSCGSYQGHVRYLLLH
jgi:hypothetical protein